MRDLVRRWRLAVEWWLAQPVVVAELRPGDRLLMRDGTVMTVRRVRPMPEPPAWQMMHVDLVGEDGQFQRLYRQAHTRAFRRATPARGPVPGLIP